MAVLNIDKYLDLDNLPKNRIARVGIEFEGGWMKTPKGARIERDGSVKNFPETLEAIIGEIASPPLIPAAIDNWIDKNYPEFINETCGLHVHMSYENALNYMRLMVPEYQDTMIEYLKRWATRNKIPKSHHFWGRLNGDSEYCQLKFWADRQVGVIRKDYDRKKDGHRYTAVNYCHGLHNMQTMEVRVMPMFDTPELGTSAVHEVLNITNGCLVKLTKKERAVSAEFDLTNNSGLLVDQAIALYR